MGDFHGWAGHEGRRARQGAVNVGFSALHEGRGAGKIDHLWGSRKARLVFGRENIGRIAEWLGRTASSYRFALAAFLIPLFIRSIPEILVGPYPIGWDTIAFYVPTPYTGQQEREGFSLQRLP